MSSKAAGHSPAYPPSRPAFYAHTGTLRGDLWALLHVPYTAWHLSYVVFGAALAPQLDGIRLLGVLAAFFFGTGIAAHAFDERNGHPLHTELNDRTLLVLGVGGTAAGALAGVVGAVIVSPWALAWVAAGVLLMLAYTLEWPTPFHSDIAFGVTWGGFPVLVGYWAQTGSLGTAALLVAVAATLLSLAQRALSTPARYARRRVLDASAVFEGSHGREVWPRAQLLATWEEPLQLLAAAVVLLACGLVLMRL